MQRVRQMLRTSMADGDHDARHAILTDPSHAVDVIHLRDVDVIDHPEFKDVRIGQLAHDLAQRIEQMPHQERSGIVSAIHTLVIEEAERGEGLVRYDLALRLVEHPHIGLPAAAIPHMVQHAIVGSFLYENAHVVGSQDDIDRAGNSMMRYIARNSGSSAYREALKRLLPRMSSTAVSGLPVTSAPHDLRRCIDRYAGRAWTDFQDMSCDDMVYFADPTHSDTTAMRSAAFSLDDDHAWSPLLGAILQWDAQMCADIASARVNINHDDVLAAACIVSAWRDTTQHARMANAARRIVGKSGDGPHAHALLAILGDHAATHPEIAYDVARSCSAGDAYRMPIIARGSTADAVAMILLERACAEQGWHGEHFIEAAEACAKHSVNPAIAAITHAAVGIAIAGVSQLTLRIEDLHTPEHRRLVADSPLPRLAMLTVMNPHGWDDDDARITRARSLMATIASWGQPTP